MVWYQLSGAVTSGAAHSMCMCVEDVWRPPSTCLPVHKDGAAFPTSDMGDVFPFVSVSYSMSVK